MLLILHSWGTQSGKIIKIWNVYYHLPLLLYVVSDIFIYLFSVLYNKTKPQIYKLTKYQALVFSKEQNIKRGHYILRVQTTNIVFRNILTWISIIQRKEKE